MPLSESPAPPPAPKRTKKVRWLSMYGIQAGFCGGSRHGGDTVQGFLHSAAHVPVDGKPVFFMQCWPHIRAPYVSMRTTVW